MSDQASAPEPVDSVVPGGGPFQVLGGHAAQDRQLRYGRGLLESVQSHSRGIGSEARQRLFAVQEEHSSDVGGSEQ